jgi:hypothetical protein
MAPSIRWWPRGRLSWSALFTAWPIPSSIRPSACRPVWSRFDRTGVVSARVPAAAPRGCSRVPPRPMSHLLVLRMSSWVPYPSLRSRRLVDDDVAVGVGAAAHHHRVLVPITINERSHPSIRALPPCPWGRPTACLPCPVTSCRRPVRGGRGRAVWFVRPRPAGGQAAVCSAADAPSPPSSPLPTRSTPFFFVNPGYTGSLAQYQGGRGLQGSGRRRNGACQGSATHRLAAT